MILSARAIAAEMADSDAGEFLPSHCVNFRAARMQAAIRSTRFLPSPMSASVAYSPFIRHKRIHFFIIDFRICTAEVHKFGMYRAVQEEAEGMQRACRLEAPLHKRVFRKGCGPSDTFSPLLLPTNVARYIVMSQKLRVCRAISQI